MKSLLLSEPGVLTVELGGPSVDAWKLVVVWLVDVNVQHPVVDALAERPVATRFQIAGRFHKVTAAGE